MPQRHFLSSKGSLSQQVAAWLPDSVGSGTLLITPTAGATRQIRYFAGLTEAQANTVLQPMQALLPECENIAGRVECCLAWATALGHISDESLTSLFRKQIPRSPEERLKVSGDFCHLCDQLTEIGTSPQIFQLPRDLKNDFEGKRWSSIAALYREYLKCLKGWDLHDPNVLRLNRIDQGNHSIQQVIIACIPDLPRAFEQYAGRLEREGVSVDILIWNPQNAPADSFDAWGRPVTEVWNTRLIPIHEEQIYVAASAPDEAKTAVSKVIQRNSNLVVVDSTMNAMIATEISAHNRTPYLPDGKPLMKCEAARILLRWTEFRQSKDLRSLRRLLESPAFCRLLDTEGLLSQKDALLAIDYLLNKTIAKHPDSAWKALSDKTVVRDVQIRDKARCLLALTRSQIKFTFLELVNNAYPEGDSFGPESTERILKILTDLEASGAVSARSEFRGKSSIQIYMLAIQGESIRTVAQKDDVVVNGWLEAPWLGEAPLVLCGLTEGCLPQSVKNDPFLPDSIRSLLGMSHHSQRLARDAYLLSALLCSGAARRVQVSLSKYNSAGDPNRPSRLLFRTGSGELPQRVLYLTKTSSPVKKSTGRKTNWRWHLSMDLPEVKTISPTQFESYLACPLRFCFKEVLRLRPWTSSVHEMDAAMFGKLLHRSLENFGRWVIPGGEKMLQMDESGIHQKMRHFLEKEAVQQFGSEVSPAVQIQIANAEIRLRAFARVQSACFKEGWMIIDVEHKLEAVETNSLSIGPLKLSGVIDRIDQNIETGQLRVVDYKTFSVPKKPAENHLASDRNARYPQALVKVYQKQGLKSRAWKNLQLPLYRRILEHRYPEETKIRPPITAYFSLPSDPNESGIHYFEEMDRPENSTLYQSALTCAEAVASDIKAGIYWPPQPFRGDWEDPLAPILANGAPENCIHPESIDQFKGGRRE